jgi:hypothetical protein
LDDYHLITRLHRLRQRIRGYAIDKDANVTAHLLLLINHAKADSGILSIQV